MWTRKEYHHLKNNNFKRKQTYFIDKEFQVKYTSAFVAAALVGMIMVSIPILYLLKQNYQIFTDLAYQNSPEIVEHLETEKKHIILLLGATFIGLMTFFSIIGFRMTSHLIGPLKVLTNHLKLLSKGQWSQKEIVVRENDEFKDLIDSYNYFYNSFRKQVLKDLKTLQDINVNTHNREEFSKWQSMIQEKLNQLDMEPPKIVEPEVPQEKTSHEIAAKMVS